MRKKRRRILRIIVKGGKDIRERRLWRMRVNKRMKMEKKEE